MESELQKLEMQLSSRDRMSPTISLFGAPYGQHVASPGAEKKWNRQMDNDVEVKLVIEPEFLKVELQSSSRDQAQPQLVPLAPTLSLLAAPFAQPMVISEALFENKWNHYEIIGLVYEVASCIKQSNKFDHVKDLAIALYLKLQPAIANWDVRVKPGKVKKVARAVYRDLCRGRRKNCVTLDVLIWEEYIDVIMDNIRKHLVAPEDRNFTRFSRCGCCF